MVSWSCSARLALLALAAAALPVAAHAAEIAPCTAASTSLECRLTGLLHWLEATALVLGLVLVVVVGVAIHLFRKNRLGGKAGR